MRSIFRHAVLALILLTAAAISALTAMRLAIHGREVEVPKLVGLSPQEAEETALEEGLLVEVENRYYSPTIPEGRILSQYPEAGVQVRRGWRLRLAESLGPQHLVIPNVVGQSLRSAELNLRRSGLEPAEIGFITLPGLPPDQVVSQSPQGGAANVASMKVGLLVTSPPAAPEYVMPNVVGSSVAVAAGALEKAGIKVRYPRPSTLPEVSPASNKAAVPLALQSEAQAEETPEARDVTVLSPTPKVSAASVVISQTPAAGTKLTPGSMIELHVR